MGKNTRKTDKKMAKANTKDSHMRRVRDVSNITLIATIMTIYLLAIMIALIHS